MIPRKEKLLIDEYFNLLQLEYLSYYLRSKIYEDAFFVKMCEDICEKKKNKILNITRSRPRLNSIFSDQNEWKRVVMDEFLTPYGPPNFKYPPGKLGMVFYDNLYSFKPGFRVRDRGGIFTIISNSPDDNCIEISNDVCKKKVRYIDVELLIGELLNL